MEAKVQFFCCCCSENGISSPKKRHAINQYINISRFLIQLEWTPQSSHVISSRSHFSHPGPDVPSSPRASVSTATPWTVCRLARLGGLFGVNKRRSGWISASLAKHLLTGRTSERRRHGDEKKRSERLLGCINPADTAQIYYKGGGEGNWRKA